MIETLRIEPSEIETIRGKEIIRVRDSIIPLLRLNKVLGNRTTEIESNDKIFIVVVKTGERLVGIVVDALMEQQEIVVKSLGKYLGDIEGIAGATILGDGQVALILDIGSLVKMAAQSNIDKIRQQMEVVSTLNPTPAR